MFQPWRLQLQEARVALRSGSLDEAGKLLQQGDLLKFLPAKNLSAKLAHKFLQRAEIRVERGESSAGWSDLQQASELAGSTDELERVRSALVERSLVEVRTLLGAGQADEALARLERLSERNQSSSDVRRLYQATYQLKKSLRLCQRGQFAEAETELSSAAALCPEVEAFSQRLQECRLNRAEVCRQNQALHRALVAEDWYAVLEASETLLELAPDHSQARSAKCRAWAAVGVKATQAHVDKPKQNHQRRASTGTGIKSPKVDTVAERTPGERFLLWLDAVGGFLVCLGDEIILGPPTSDSAADVPILGDISRRHAVLRRDREGYLIQPLRDTKLDGRPLDGPTTLVDGNIIELGDGVQLRFRRPHALSMTARLEMVSAHRFDPSVDAVLLMADSCVLGAAKHSHIVCRDWPSDVVLFRQGESLTCRHNGPIEVDGKQNENKASIQTNSRVVGDEFSFTLEPLESL